VWLEHFAEGDAHALAMPAKLRTMDIELVYDEVEERITMGWRLGGFSAGLSVGAAGAQSQNSQGQMEGMDMGQAKPAKNPGCGGGMDMGHCAAWPLHGDERGIGDAGKGMPPLAAGRCASPTTETL